MLAMMSLAIWRVMGSLTKRSSDRKIFSAPFSAVNGATKIYLQVSFCGLLNTLKVKPSYWKSSTG